VRTSRQRCAIIYRGAGPPHSKTLGNMRIRILVLLLASASSCAAADDDACRAQLPASLVSALRHDFPRARLPLVSDNLAEDIKFNKSREVAAASVLHLATSMETERGILQLASRHLATAHRS